MALNNQLEKKKDILTTEETEFEKLKIDLSAKLKQKIQKIKSDSKQKDILIKQRFQGLYTYQWLHQRKTWNFAEKALYFDFGDGVLFERVEDGLFRKVTKQDFIDEHLS